jgi:DnaJ-class molecular chaperone
MSQGLTKVCPRCNGSGGISTAQGFETCPKCDGAAMVQKGMHEQMDDDSRQALGTVGGAALGFSAGGPAGALIGGAVGAFLSSSDDDGHEISGR